MIPKFRAWDKHNKKMFTNEELIIWNDNVYANDRRKLSVDKLKGWSISDKFLMQSTGLADKNGVEIFEGDILKDDSESGKVVYDPDRTMWRVYGKDFDDALSDWWMGRVIGNIYENPELMEGNA